LDTFKKLTQYQQMSSASTKRDSPTLDCRKWKYTITTDINV